MAVVLLAGLGLQAWPRAQEGELIVSAAASVADVMGELAARYRDEAGVEVRVNTGGSNTLARQIVEGAPVDVFVSADEAQMDVVEEAGRLVAGSRQDLLTNTLVIVMPASPSGGWRGQTQPAIGSAQDLALPGIRRIAMGNPDSVPAGVYGRRWLDRVGVWRAVSSKVIPFPTVRAALSAVQEGRADAGIVYATDARVTTTVRVAVTAPTDEAPAVVYPAAAIRGAREPTATRFLAWLRTEAPSRGFHRAGFGIAGARPSQIGMEVSRLQVRN